MRTFVTILTLIVLITLGCTNETETAVNLSDLKSGPIVKDSIIQITTSDSTQNINKVTNDSLPIHGTLNQKQIDQYYPKILDTIRDLRIISSEPIAIKINSNIYVSILHNAGTSDQMFLCTHDKEFNLMDNIYIGTNIMFDRTSHTINYKLIGEGQLEFHHVNWGYVKRNGENEIDTLSYRKYKLTITKTGKIIKK